MIPFDALPQNVLPEQPALQQPWLSTGLVGGYAANAFGPRQMVTAKHVGAGVNSIVHLNDGTTRRVVAATSTTNVDLTVLTVDADLPTWCPVREAVNFNPADAMFIGAGRTPAAPVLSALGAVRGWYWGDTSGTLNWTRSELAYARYALEDYEVTFRAAPGSFAMTAGDSGGGFYTSDAAGNWNLQGVGVGIYLYNGLTEINGASASQFRPALPPYNVTYQGSEMLMPRTWLRSLTPIDGDANLNGTVDFDDLLAIVQNFGGTGTWSSGDFTGDQQVTFDDMLLLGQHYSGPPSDLDFFQTLVPEPGTIGLICPLLISRRRR